MRLFRLDLILFIFLIFLSGKSLAQRKFGNEWIHYGTGQKYYKFPIVKDSIYRIDYTVFNNSSINIASIDTSELQIFYRGTQVPIYIADGGNGRIDNNGEYIEFFGLRNDGALDSLLFVNPTMHPSNYSSMFTDTSIYYFTWTKSEPSKRISVYKQKPSVSPMPYYMEEFQRYFTDFSTPKSNIKYFNGAAIDIKNSFYSSEYTEGEGYGYDLSKNNTTRKPAQVSQGYPTPGWYSASGKKGEAEFLAYTKNGADTTPNHRIQLMVGASKTATSISPSNYKLIFEDVFSGAKTVRKKLYFDTTGINIFVKVVVPGVQSPNDPLLNSYLPDRFALSYIKMRYPRNFIFTKWPTTRFSIQNDSTNQNYLSFTGFLGGATPPLYLYDIKNGMKTRASFLNDTLLFCIKNNKGKTPYYLFDSTKTGTVSSLTKVNFMSVDTKGKYDFIIVTHSSLAAAAKLYADYKKTEFRDTTKSLFKPLLVYADSIYDAFLYGQTHHPAAIQNFLNYYWRNCGVVKPEYLLLLGKGWEYSESGSIRSDSDQLKARDLVPTIGAPPSDIMYVTGLSHNFTGRDTIVRPPMVVGRISVQSNNDILTYLQKLKDYNTTSKEFWHKNVLHIGGGTYDYEQDAIREYMRGLEQIVEDTLSGYNVSSFFSKSSNSVDKTLIAQIEAQLNIGKGLFTYYGHGAPNVIGVDIGEPHLLTNYKKYPVMYLNGCTVGNVGIDSSLGERYLLAKDRGCIAWIAHSSTTELGRIHDQMEKFYTNTAYDMYGAPIGKIYQDVQGIPDSDPNSDLARMSAYQLVFQGDPSVKSYNLSCLDYALYDAFNNPSNTFGHPFIFPQDVISTSDSFAVAIPVYNLGKATNDSFQLKIERTLSNQSKLVYDVQTFPAVHYADTIYFWMKNKSKVTQGLNKFRITLDPFSKLKECDKSDNSALFNFYFPGNGVRQLYPLEYAIAPSTKDVELVMQSRNPLDTKTECFIEIDTSKNFDSKYKHGIKKPGGSEIKWTGYENSNPLLGLLSNDSQVYYWRARMNLPSDSGGDWQTRSFTYIKGSPLGWNQSHFPQYAESMTLNDITLDTIKRLFKFSNYYLTVTVNSNPWTTSLLGITPENNNNLTAGSGLGICGSKDIQMIVFDRTTLKPTPSSGYPNPCQTTPPIARFYRMYDLKDSTDCNLFLSDVSAVQDSDYVLICSRGSKHNFRNSFSSSKTAFKMLGSKMFDTLSHDSSAYVICGQKGSSVGKLIKEDYQFDPDPKKDGPNAEIKPQLIGLKDNGYVTSRTIGPASSWKAVYQTYRSLEVPTLDSYYLKITAIKSDNSEMVYKDHLKDYYFGLDSLDAAQYPYLRIESHLFDPSDNRTPPQLTKWKVLYTSIREGTIIIDSDYVFQKAILEMGDSLRFKAKFKNISLYPFDSVKVDFYTEDYYFRVKPLLTKYFKPLQSDSSFVMNEVFSIKGLSGPMKFVASVNPNFAQDELTLDNNIIKIPFTVKGDEINPILDVTFDGRHILNNDVVSAKPLILISNKDENKFLKLDDPNKFTILLKKPGISAWDSVKITDPSIIFKPAVTTENKAIIEYRPTLPMDGIWSLKVQARDMNDNKAGDNFYSIDFTVYNKPMVTNFYVYPNPFSTKAKFVFTLTGSEVPDFFKIQIMTVTGRVVKEIDKNELGTVRVGNNISDFTWDGTDEYGDKLANGLYLYRVLVKANGRKLDNFETKTDSDKFFSHEIGKLYILR